MATNIDKFVSWCYAAILLIVIVVKPIDVSANELDSSIGQAAILIAEQIEAQDLVPSEDWIGVSLALDNLSNERDLSLLRQVFMVSVSEVGPAELKNISKKYSVLASSAGTEQDVIVGELFGVFSETYDINSVNISELEQALSIYLNHENWFVRHRAMNLIVGALQGLDGADWAMQKAQEAIEIIPKKDTQYTLEARILSAENMAFLHNIMKNPELAVKETRQLINLQSLTSWPINGPALINNFIYSFSHWRDHETAAELGKILLNIEEKHNVGTPGLTAMRMAVTKNNQADFEEAYQYAKMSQESAEHDLIMAAATKAEFIALAGLGNVTEAKSLLAKFEADAGTDVLTKPNTIDDVLYAQFLIALAQDDLSLATSLYNSSLDHNAQSLLANAVAETSAKLAELQNTKDRVAEREAALKRETDLRQQALDNEKETNRLLRILLAVLAFAVLAALAFSRYRVIVSRRLEKSAELALAGEKSKSEFLALMSHELRTPLNGIIGLADYLAVQAPSEDVRDKTGVILKSGHDLLALVENILDMTLIEAGELHVYPEEIDVHPIVEKMVEKWNQVVDPDKVTFTWHVDPTVPRQIILDPKRMTQCLDQLLSNAVKFTEKGRIHLHVLGDGSTEEPSVQFIVADTGIGISESAKPRLFKPFVQADTSMTRLYGGAGLGLAITKNLAQMMNGDVIVNSKTGRGSEFVLTLKGEKTVPENLPVEIPTRAVPSLTARKEPVPDMETVKIPRRILAVEDDVASQNVLRSLLEPAGCKVICVPNGNFALEALKENIFDLVLMDIRMPALNGIETTRRIRAMDKAYANIPIIAVTADASPEAEARCMAVGMNSYLTKPVNARVLFEAFDRVGQSIELQKSA